MLSWSWSSRSYSGGYLRDYSPQWTPFFSQFPVVTQSASSRGLWRRHFQWPWTTPNPVFKVTAIVTMDWYGGRIGNRTQAFEWYQFEWTSVTYNPDFKVTIIERQITRKRYKIELYLQWPTNRKSYYDLSNGTIFNDLERPLPPVSRSRHSLTLNISEYRQLQWSTNRDLHTPYSTVSFRMTLYTVSHKKNWTIFQLSITFANTVRF